MDWTSLPPRNLERSELEELVDQLALEPEQWRAQIAFSDSKRHYISLHRDDYVDVWLLCWTPVNDTGWHDHDISSGAVHVVQGAVTDASPRIGGEPVIRVVPAGRRFSFGPERIHRMTGSEPDSVSIHAYSPPLWRLGQYAIDSDGVMQRTSVSYAEELRPLEPESLAS